ncbi:hypothetical protein C9374_009317 [Naegleria lovaniensis]|uniref:Selenoprotein F n=1 Tax=Naegleria lovaniensis TaxID=51637 RepID=A0AA88GJ13_NAELO|nr:uncharacterized protein C9374_009317 [Naegleria lovaniensis]KAG2377406.1 hypothetical protein C9374_009317 [Naegleria lovaniensis]
MKVLRKPVVILACLLLWIGIILFSVSVHSATLTPQQCEDLGFKSSELSCSTCKEFSLFLSEKKIIENCNNCCQDVTNQEKGESSSNATEKEFVSGVLYMCYCNIRSFPEIEGFMNNDAKKFRNLQVLQRQGVMPTLSMKRKDGSEESHLVSHWKIDEIKEFLNEKLLA